MRVLTVNLFNRTLRVYRPRAEHIGFLMTSIGLQLLCALLSPRFMGLISVGFVLMWLVIPCHDPKFGNGRPFFWQRQASLIFGALLIAIISIV